MKISLGLADFFILALVLQGLILAALLLYTSKKISSNRWIAYFILVVAETTLFMEFQYSGLSQKHSELIPFMLVLRLAIGPLLYFYTRSLTYGDRKLGFKDYIQFLPVLLDMQPQIIYLLYITGILSIPAVTDFYFLPQTQDFLFNHTIFDNLPTFLSLVIYSTLSYRMVNKAIAGGDLSKYKLADLKWVKNLLYGFFALVAIYIFNTVLIATIGWNGYIVYFLYIPVTLFIYWVGMSTYFRQSKMYSDDVVQYNTIPAKVYYSDNEAAKYHQLLVELMEKDRLYLDPQLKLDVLVARLNLPEKLISNLLNQHIGKNFNDFVNEYRIAEAKIKLKDPAFNKFTIAAIAYECGFNSLATFQRCFKQFTGTTPSKYQNGFSSINLQVNTTQIPI